MLKKSRKALEIECRHSTFRINTDACEGTATPAIAFHQAGTMESDKSCYGIFVAKSIHVQKATPPTEC